MWPNPRETADLVTFTEEILNGKVHFLCIEVDNFAKVSLIDNCYYKLFNQDINKIFPVFHRSREEFE